MKLILKTYHSEKFSQITCSSATIKMAHGKDLKLSPIKISVFRQAPVYFIMAKLFLRVCKHTKTKTVTHGFSDLKIILSVLINLVKDSLCQQLQKSTSWKDFTSC